MMTTKNHKFDVSEGLVLNLESLYAQVIVSAGQHGLATVDLEGDEKLLKDIKVTGNSRQIDIKGTGSEGGITVIQSGRNSSVQIGGTIRGQSIVVGSNLVIVNGKVVSGGQNITTVEGDTMPTIKVKVPRGTELEAYDVEKLTSKGLSNKVTISLSGQGEAEISDATGMKIDCSGQSSCTIENATGDVNADASGQSHIEVNGNVNDVDADSSGQSNITINGNCHNCNGDASGQSRVRVTGHASGRVRVRESGMGRVSVREG